MHGIIRAPCPLCLLDCMRQSALQLPLLSLVLALAALPAFASVLAATRPGGLATIGTSVGALQANAALVSTASYGANSSSPAAPAASAAPKGAHNGVPLRLWA